MSAVIYARVPDSLKTALAAFAAEHSLSLTRAVVELLEHGLARIAQEQPAAGLEETQAQLKQTELRLQAALERERHTARAYNAVVERSRQPLVSCPTCRQPASGSDLLVSGRCPHCTKPLTSLLVPTPRAGMDRDEYLALMGALGVLVGLAHATTESAA